jgi:hypothetical protein
MMSLVGADTRSRHHLGMGRREPTHGMVSSSRYVVDPAAYRRVLPVDNSNTHADCCNLELPSALATRNIQNPRWPGPRNASDKRRGPETT